MIVLAAVLIALCGTSYGQYYNTAHSARSSAMGGCFLPDDTVRRLTVDYRRTFMMAEMASKSIEAVWPTGQTGVLGASYCRTGGKDYHEQSSTLGYALRAAPWLNVGVAAHYLHIGTSDAYYETMQWLAASAMVQATVYGRVSFTLLGGTRPWDRNRPWRAHAQMAYRPMRQVLTVVEAESEERVRLRFGMEYCYRELLFFRAGMATNPVSATFGIGVRYRMLGIDIGAETHRVLGITPQTSLTLWF